MSGLREAMNAAEVAYSLSDPIIAAYPEQEALRAQLQAKATDMVYVQLPVPGGGNVAALFLNMGVRIVVSVGGTDYVGNDWSFWFRADPRPAFRLREFEAHDGFATYAEAIWAKARGLLWGWTAEAQEYCRKIYFVGHSAGGAIAILLALAATQQTTTKHPQAYQCVTWGAPRVFTSKSASLYPVNTRQWITAGDIVPTVPIFASDASFGHVGQRTWMKQGRLWTEPSSRWWDVTMAPWRLANLYCSSKPRHYATTYREELHRICQKTESQRSVGKNA